MPPDTNLGTAAPPFDEPWQAKVYGMAQVLMAEGRISKSDWADALSAAIAAQIAAGADDTSQTYFIAVTKALETVMQIEARELTEATNAWRDAHLATPHGKPVRLGR